MIVIFDPFFGFLRDAKENGEHWPWAGIGMPGAECNESKLEVGQFHSMQLLSSLGVVA